MTTMALLFAGEDERRAEAGAALAAAEADPTAENCLKVGALYAQGLGVEEDEAEALRWYRRSAEAGGGVAALVVFALRWEEDRAAALREAAGLAEDLDDEEDFLDMLLPFQAMVAPDLAGIASRAEDRVAELTGGVRVALGRHLAEAGGPHREVGLALLRHAVDHSGDADARAALEALGVEARDPMDEFAESLPEFRPSSAGEAPALPEEAESTLMAHELVAENLNEFGTLLLAQQLEGRAAQIREAAARKEPEALYQSALLALARSEEAESRRLLVEAAEAGWGPAAFRLANLARYPEDGEPDLAEATRWLEEAAEARHPGAALALGVLRFRGPRTGAQFTRAREALLVAAHHGTKSTRGMAGGLLYWGNGAARDRREGLAALRKAATEGFAAGALTLRKIRGQVLAARDE